MHRREKDSMGAIDVPADKLWGAQTQRSAFPDFERENCRLANPGAGVD